MSAPIYSNGKTPQPGDLIAVNLNGFKYPFVVTAVGAPANVPGATPDPVHPELQLTGVPFVGLQQVNVAASATELWADAYPGTPMPPIVPNPFGGR